MMIVLYYLLNLILWLLRQTEEGVQWVTTKLDLANMKEKLSIAVECTEESGPQELVIPGIFVIVVCLHVSQNGCD